MLKRDGLGDVPCRNVRRTLVDAESGILGRSLSRLGNMPEHLIGSSTMIRRIATRNFLGDMPEVREGW